MNERRKRKSYNSVAIGVGNVLFEGSSFSVVGVGDLGVSCVDSGGRSGLISGISDNIVNVSIAFFLGLEVDGSGGGVIRDFSGQRLLHGVVHLRRNRCNGSQVIR